MSLSPEAITRLARLGWTSEGDLRRWHWIWQEGGDEFVSSFLEREEAVADDYRLGYPRLRAFATDCRLRCPIPDVSGLTASQREQHEIIISVLQQDAGDNFTECARRPPPNRASIVYSSTAGLPALAEVFGDSAAVILEESELQQWRDHVLDPAHDPARAWHQESWWKLHRPHWTDEFAVRLTDARQLWVMESGRLTQGSGGGHEDHWLWDGTRAEFLKRRSMWLT